MILVVSTSALGILVVSTTAAISTSLVVSSVTSSVSSVILVSVHVLLHHIGTLRHFILQKVDEFLDGVDVLLFALMVQIVSGLPELNVESSSSKSELVGLVKGLDALLSFLDILETDESHLGSNCLATGSIVDHEFLDLDRDDLSDFSHFGGESFFGDVLWNVLDHNVRLEGLLECLSDRWCGIGGLLVIIVVDELGDHELLSIQLELLIKSIDCSLGLLVGLESNVADVRAIALECNTGDLTELSEDISEVLLGKLTRWEVLDKEVAEVFALILSLVFLGEDVHLDFFVLDLEVVELL